MAAEVSWYKPGKVILIKTPRAVSDADVRALDPILYRYLSSSEEHPIHLIIDDSEMESMASVEAYKSLQALKHPKMGWIVVVGLHNKVFRMMYAILCHMKNIPVYMAETLDEAIQFIEHTDVSQPLPKF